jgi:hypothetical protein
VKRKRLTTELRWQVIAKTGTKCHYCKKEGFLDPDRPLFPVVLEEKPYKYWINIYDGTFIWLHKAMHVDHVIPVSKGGENKIENLVVACEKCNESKRARIL